MGSDQPCRFPLLDNTGSATNYVKIRVLQQQQITDIRNNASYESVMYLSQDSIQDLQHWRLGLETQQPGKSQWQTNCVSKLQNSKTIRCLQKGLGLKMINLKSLKSLKSFHFQVDNLSTLS